MIKNLSGRNLGPADAQATFFDLGFDSLLLTQASQALRQKFGVKLTFRQLMENLASISAVAEYLNKEIPADKFTIAPAATVSARSRRPPGDGVRKIGAALNPPLASSVQ